MNEEKQKLLKRLTKLRRNLETAILMGDYESAELIKEEIDDIILSNDIEKE